MKKTITVLLFLLVSKFAISQINISDSTVQTVAYWNKHETQNYSISTEKYKVNKGDTTVTEILNYDVTITIIDSTSNSYIVEWHYKNYRIQSDNEFMLKLIDKSKDFRLLIKTDEMGKFIEVINWKEYKKYSSDILKAMKKEYKKAPTLVKLLNESQKVFSTKQAIESIGINEVKQYYFFYGLQYKLGEIYEDDVQIHNALSNEPMDVHLTYYLDDINDEDNNYIMRAFRVVDSTQLINSTYNYLAKNMKTAGLPAPNKDKLSSLKNDIETGSRIHDLGWLIYSYQTNRTVLDNTETIEKTIIELQ